jgi:ribosomal protein S1
LLVEEKILVVENEKERCGAGCKVLQVPAFDTKSTVAALVRNAEGMVVDLAVLGVFWNMAAVAWGYT